MLLQSELRFYSMINDGDTIDMLGGLKVVLETMEWTELDQASRLFLDLKELRFDLVGSFVEHDLLLAIEDGWRRGLKVSERLGHVLRWTIANPE